MGGGGEEWAEGVRGGLRWAKVDEWGDGWGEVE